MGMEIDNGPRVATGRITKGVLNYATCAVVPDLWSVYHVL